jgi:hypothetical protein
MSWMVLLKEQTVMDFLPTLFSFLVSGSVAAAFISIMMSGMLDGVARMFYIYFGWGGDRTAEIEQEATLTR